MIRPKLSQDSRRLQLDDVSTAHQPVIFTRIPSVGNSSCILKPTVALPSAYCVCQVGVVRYCTATCRGGGVAIPLRAAVHALLEGVDCSLEDVTNNIATILRRCIFMIGYITFFAEHNTGGSGVRAWSIAVTAEVGYAGETARDSWPRC